MDNRISTADRRSGGDRRNFNYTAHAPERRTNNRRVIVNRRGV